MLHTVEEPKIPKRKLMECVFTRTFKIVLNYKMVRIILLLFNFN